MAVPEVATAKPYCAPDRSDNQPARAAAPAEPAALAELSQVNAWVSAAGWTAFSVSTPQSTRIGGIAPPVSRLTDPSPSGESTISGSVLASARMDTATTSCTREAARHLDRPYNQPVSSPLQLEAAKITAAVSAAPCWTVKAVVATWVAPKYTPMDRFRPISSAKPGRTSERSARRRSAALGSGAGAVRCWVARARPPETISTAASNVPSIGCPPAPRALTRAGPTR